MENESLQGRALRCCSLGPLPAAHSRLPNSAYKTSQSPAPARILSGDDGNYHLEM